MLLIALIITCSERVCCHCQCLGRQPDLTAGERGHHPSLLVSLLCIITVIIIITWPKPRYVRQGLAGGIVGPRYSSLKQVHFGPFSTSRFSPLALSSNWTLILIQLLQIKGRQNVTHKQTDTVSEFGHFS